MEEGYLKINVSQIYRALKIIDSINEIYVFDDEDIDDNINSSDRFVLENFRKINAEINILSSSIENSDEKSIKASLIQLRVNVMNVASEFDSLRENMDSLLKVL